MHPIAIKDAERLGDITMRSVGTRKIVLSPRSHARRGNAAETLRVERGTHGTQSVHSAFPRRAWERVVVVVVGWSERQRTPTISSQYQGPKSWTSFLSPTYTGYTGLMALTAPRGRMLVLIRQNQPRHRFNHLHKHLI